VSRRQRQCRLRHCSARCAPLLPRARCGLPPPRAATALRHGGRGRGARTTQVGPLQGASLVPQTATAAAAAANAAACCAADGRRFPTQPEAVALLRPWYRR